MEATQIEQGTVSQFAAGLDWSANLHTGDERMDSTHEEFVTMLNALLKTPQPSNSTCTGSFSITP